jgi:hypothetical protein
MACMLFVTRATVGKVADKKGEGIFVYTCNASMFIAFILMAFVPNKVTLTAAFTGNADQAINLPLPAFLRSYPGIGTE